MNDDKNTFHPRSTILQVFDRLEDPRKKSINFRHPLTTIHKSNEIPAVPKLMELLDLKGTIITADAMNTLQRRLSLELTTHCPLKKTKRAC